MMISREENVFFERLIDALLEIFKHSEEDVKFPDISVSKEGPTNRPRYSDSLTEQFRSLPRTIDHGVNPEHKKRLDHLSELHTVKNAKYGNSFDRGLDKHGVISWIVRDEDKENRMLELFDQCIKKDPESGEWFFDGMSIDGNDESLSDTILDRANYLIMLDMWIKQLPTKRYKKIYADNKVFDTISILEERDEEVSDVSGVTIKKHISQEEWDSKLCLGWPEYDLEKIYSVFVPEEQYREEWDTYDKDK